MNLQGTLRVETFGITETREAVNHWLAQNHVDVVSIQLSTTGDLTNGGGETIMIVYHERKKED